MLVEIDPRVDTDRSWKIEKVIEYCQKGMRRAGQRP